MIALRKARSAGPPSSESFHPTRIWRRQAPSAPLAGSRFDGQGARGQGGRRGCEAGDCVQSLVDPVRLVDDQETDASRVAPRTEFNCGGRRRTLGIQPLGLVVAGYPGRMSPSAIDGLRPAITALANVEGEGAFAPTGGCVRPRDTGSRRPQNGDGFCDLFQSSVALFLRTPVFYASK